VLDVARKVISTLSETCCCPEIIGVPPAGAGTDSFCNPKGIGCGVDANSFTAIDLTPSTFNPTAEAAKLALAFASSIANLISPFLISASFLSDCVKSMEFTVLAPAEMAVSNHLETLAIFELSICRELVTVNPVIIFRPCE
jgi:hypothetical protein